MLMLTNYFVLLMILPVTALIIFPLCLLVAWQFVSSIKQLDSGPDHTDDNLQSVEGKENAKAIGEIVTKAQKADLMVE